VDVTVNNFPGDSVVWPVCTDDGGANSYGATGATEVNMTDAAGYLSITDAVAFPTTDFAPTSGIKVSCTSDGVTGTYGG
jgi:hypothetical protein